MTTHFAAVGSSYETPYFHCATRCLNSRAPQACTDMCMASLGVDPPRSYSSRPVGPYADPDHRPTSYFQCAWQCNKHGDPQACTDKCLAHKPDDRALPPPGGDPDFAPADWSGRKGDCAGPCRGAVDPAHCTTSCRAHYAGTGDPDLTKKPNREGWCASLCAITEDQPACTKRCVDQTPGRFHKRYDPCSEACLAEGTDAVNTAACVGRCIRQEVASRPIGVPGPTVLDSYPPPGLYDPKMKACSEACLARPFIGAYDAVQCMAVCTNAK
jgi:hypothetical protein